MLLVLAALPLTAAPAQAAKSWEPAKALLLAATTGAITGDGLLNLMRLNEKVGYRIDSPLPVPPIFELIAERKGSDVNDVMGVVLDRPRHEGIIKEIRDTGARVD